MTAADVGKLTEDVRDEMLKTLREISTRSPEASSSSSGEARTEARGEEEPLLHDSRRSYAVESSSGARRRSPSSKSEASDSELAETGAVDAKALVRDVGESAKRAAGEGGEMEDEETEDGVIVKKPN